MDDSLKHVPLCEELVAITDDIKEALVLRQMLYWVPRMRDTDEYIKEEQAQLASDEEPAVSLTHGWVYKTGEEIAEETMIGSGKTGRRRLASLVEKGYLDEQERQNSDWDRTREYRPNVAAIQDDLQSTGYDLKTVVGKDWPLFQSLVNSSGRSGQADDSTRQDDDSKDQSADSAPAHNASTRSETTTETTTESESTRPREDEAVQVYHDVMPRRANNIQKDYIAQKVDDVDRWREVVNEWRLSDYNVANVKGMLDVYENGWRNGHTQTSSADHDIQTGFHS